MANKLSTSGDRLILGGCALGLAVLLTLLDMQRELAPFVILGFAFAGLLLLLRGGSARALMRPAALLVAVFILYGGIDAGLKLSHHMLTSEQGRTLAQIRIGAYGSSLSNGGYGQGQVIQKTFFNQVDGDARQDLVNAIPLSDLSLQPIARLGNIAYRAPGQALLGSQTFFYQAQAKTKSAWLLPLSGAYNVCYSILIAMLSLWLIVPLLRRLGTLDGLAQLGLLSTLVGVLLLVGESQPRYVFPVWFILPQLIAFAMATRPGIAGEQIPATSVWGWDMTRGTLLLLVAYFMLSFAMRWVYGESHGRVLSGWQPSLQGAMEEPPPSWFKASQKLSATRIKREGNDQRSTGFGRLALVMKIPVKIQPGGSTSAEKALCVGPDRRALDFFYYMPYQNPAAKGAFTLEVLVDGKQRWTTPLPGTSKVEHVRLADVLPADTCGTLKLNLRANRGLASASWINASQTDLYFVRLVR
jgi:hypothetical protein